MSSPYPDMRPLLDGKRVDADAIDASKHKFIGMFMPPCPEFNSTENFFGLFVCTCNPQHGSSWGMDRNPAEHWQKGHFNVPQYITMDKT